MQAVPIAIRQLWCAKGLPNFVSVCRFVSDIAVCWRGHTVVSPKFQLLVLDEAQADQESILKLSMQCPLLSLVVDDDGKLFRRRAPALDCKHPLAVPLAPSAAAPASSAGAQPPGIQLGTTLDPPGPQSAGSQLADELPSDAVGPAHAPLGNQACVGFKSTDESGHPAKAARVGFPLAGAAGIGSSLQGPDAAGKEGDMCEAEGPAAEGRSSVSLQAVPRAASHPTAPAANRGTTDAAPGSMTGKQLHNRTAPAWEGCNHQMRQQVGAGHCCCSLCSTQISMKLLLRFNTLSAWTATRT